jgi:hypothetical protein
MSAKVNIRDGEGAGFVAGVTAQNALKVTNLPTSAIGIPPSVLTSQRILREQFKDSGGGISQVVDGSVTPIEFTIKAEVGVTKWVTGFRQIIESTSLRLDNTEFNQYGSATPGNTPLTNGIVIEATQTGVTTLITAVPIGILGDYLQWCESDFVNLVGIVPGGGDYAQFDFTFDAPIVLTEGSLDEIVIRIQDDLTALTTQFANARGYQEFI